MKWGLFVGFFEEVEWSDVDAEATDSTGRPGVVTAAAAVRRPPRDSVLPVVFPPARKLAQNDNACVALGAVWCWPAGVTLELLVFSRVELPTPDAMMVFPGRHVRSVPPRDGRLRLGVRFSDGRSATNLGRLAWHSQRRDDPATDAPLLTATTADGAERFARQGIYLWPLPPPGVMDVVVRWDDLGISESRTQLDATGIIAAAGQCTSIWPDSADDMARR